jgi:hypothetical protein
MKIGFFAKFPCGPAVFVRSDTGEVVREGVSAAGVDMTVGDQWFTPIGVMPDGVRLFLSLPPDHQPPLGSVVVRASS